MQSFYGLSRFCARVSQGKNWSLARSFRQFMVSSAPVQAVFWKLGISKWLSLNTFANRDFQPFVKVRSRVERLEIPRQFLISRLSFFVNVSSNSSLFWSLDLVCFFLFWPLDYVLFLNVSANSLLFGLLTLILFECLG